MMWSTFLSKLGLINPGQRRRRKSAASQTTRPRVETLESRMAPAVASFGTSAAVLTNPPAPVVGTGATAALVTTPGDFAAFLELKGTVSETTATGKTSASFDVTTTIDLNIQDGYAEATLKHGDDFTLKLAGSELKIDFELDGHVTYKEDASGDTIVNLKFDESGYATQAGKPASADIDFHALIGLLAPGDTTTPTADNPALASLQIGESATIQTAAGDAPAYLKFTDAAHDKWDMTANSGAFYQCDASRLYESGQHVDAEGPIYMKYDGIAGETAPTSIKIDTAAHLNLGSAGDTVDHGIKLDVAGNVADATLHSYSRLGDDQGKATENMAINFEADNVEYKSQQTLNGGGPNGDVATDHEVLLVPGPTSTTPSATATDSGGTVEADLDSTFSLITPAGTDSVSHKLEQTGGPIDFDFFDKLPPSSTTAT
jgi:hypothetical protein